VKHLCAAALCNLSDLKSVRPRMVEEGAITVLTTLSRGAETRTRRVCAVILQNLSAAKSVRVEMASRSSVTAAYGLSSDQVIYLYIIICCTFLLCQSIEFKGSNHPSLYWSYPFSTGNGAIECPTHHLREWNICSL